MSGQRLEWLDDWAVNPDEPWGLVLRIGEDEKVVPPQFVVLTIEALGQTISITAGDILDEWRRQAGGH